jgi:Flp pilus assembly protein TadD
MIHVPTPVASPTLSMPPLEELLGLGLNALERGDAPAALSHWQSALVVAPHNGAVRNNLGIALMKVYRYSEALEMFRAAVFLEPTAQLYRNNLNWAQRELNAVRQEHQQ